MTTKTVYLFDALTGLFAGTYEAQASPAEPGKFIAPDHSTPKPLPALSANEAAVFDVQADVWSVVPDFRGQTFYDQTTGAAVVIEAHGAVPANLGAAKPAAMLLAEAKTAATDKINAECAAAITSGFTSSALGGAPHSYTCTLEDQSNLLALISKGAGGSFTCMNGAGVKARRAHTAAQLQTLLDDGQAHKEPRLDKARALKDQIEAIQPSATAVAEVNAVVWVFP